MCSLVETKTAPGFRWCFTWPFKKKTPFTVILILTLVIEHVFLLVICWAVCNKLAADKSPASSCLLYTISCPKSWIGYDGRCYYFSSAKGTWDFSQRNCSSYGASLAAIDTQHEMNFMMHYKVSANHWGPDHWFGLRREGERQPWKWTNDSIFNNWFNIGDKGFCAYLNNKGPFSTRCDTPQNWICSKSLHSFHCKDVPTNTSSLDSGYQLMKTNCSMPES
ncbi:UNVERIFIED_CONTAM: hypothetical protein K2H54_060097 [Gekko kuhli]